MKDQFSNLYKTKDGSDTLYVSSLDAYYHSVHGAIQESTHIFIENGLKQVNKKCISVFEVGLGTGLNAYLSLLYAIKNSINIHYYGIEKYPISSKYINELNYAKILGESQPLFDRIHECTWEHTHIVDAFFTLIKRQIDIRKIANVKHIDIIFYDAFAPSVQPDLWTPMIFEKLYEMLNEDGFLITYCAKGQVKRDLRKVGFDVRALKGPVGKREITQAVKKPF